MKSLFWIVLLIIILVCINWLNDGFAQVSPDQVSAYKEYLKLKKQQQGVSGVDTYRSPVIFENDSDAIHDSLTDLYRHRSDSLVRKANQRPVARIKKEEGDSTPQLVRPDTLTLQQFGHNIFRNSQIGEINNAAIPESYLLGPGDNIIISLWGRVQQEWDLTVDREGKVFIPKVGEITAWGLTLASFEKQLDAGLSQVYSGYERRVTLGKIRTIKVFVYGAVKAPGGYAISALATLFNALYMAGGPTETGSLRQIKVIRDQKTSPVDLYDFLVKGDKRCDVPLLSGDVVFVPLVGPQATVRGQVRRPGTYELVGNEKVSDLLGLAGGPTADAYLGRLMLDRVAGADSRKVSDLDFSSPDKQDVVVADGDDLSVFSIYEMRHNIVWISGKVKHPGTFERSEGMHVSDLIGKGQLLPNDVYLERADLYRHQPDGRIEILPIRLKDITAGSAHDLLLNDLDSLRVYGVNEVERKKTVEIDGMVQNPGIYPLYNSMTVADLVFLAGNFTANAYTLEAELARIDSQGTVSVLQIRIDNPEQDSSFLLQENDHLFVRQIPGYQLHRMVTIEGEVRFPGRYSLSKDNETLWHLLSRAGGFTDKAFPTGLVFRRRAIMADLERKNIDGIMRSSVPLVADSAGELKPAQIVALDEENSDRIVIDIDHLLSSQGTIGDFPLQAGDSIYVPELPSGISVLGEVCAKGTIKHQPNKKVKFYLEQAGGFTKRADKGDIRLVKANGRVCTSGNVSTQKVDVGDVIIVPVEIKRDHDWLKLVTTSLSILTGVATSVLIINKL